MDSPNGKKPPEQGGPKRRRPRKRTSSASEGESRNEPRETKPQGGRSDKSRRAGRKRRKPAVRALSKQSEPIELDKNAEEPLSKQEVEVLREHFRFLRKYRKDLRLKVNASEDLLLNGVREPVHRGVCHHLLAKVQRSNVLAAVERLEPARAATLLAGIIRFSGEIEYVLLFLECIQQSSPPAEATAALFQGLQRIEFDKVSSAQMRRVLQLMTELFDEKERPTLLLGMLESTSFRQAFDKSTADLPDALVHLVLPLRAAQSVIFHGEPNRFDSETLRDGVTLLLGLDSRILLRHSAEMRQRLFHYGLQCCGPPDHRLHDRLQMLLRHFPSSDPKRKMRGLALARHLMAADCEPTARRLLQTLASDHPDFGVPTNWLRFLDARRFDRIALLEQTDDPVGAPDQNPRHAGIWLETMRPVWVQIARTDEVSTHEATCALMNELALPGVACVLDSGTTNEGNPYFAVANVGQSLDAALTENGGLELQSALRACHEAVGLLSALAALGIRLPDVDPVRFSLEGSGALVLTDLAGARRVDCDTRGQGHLDLARSFCGEVLDRVRRHIVPAEVTRMVSEANSCAELARGLARCRS